MFPTFRFDRLPTTAPDEPAAGGMWSGAGQGQPSKTSDEAKGQAAQAGDGETGAAGTGTGGDEGSGADGIAGENTGEGGQGADGSETGQAGEGAAPPESPDGYEFKVPEGVELPDGVQFQFDENDPAAKLGRQLAHQAGLDQKGFEEQLLKPFIEARMQEHSAEVERQAAELEKLGDNVGERIDGVNNWLSQNLDEDQAQALRGAANTAAGVQALETLIRKAGGPTAPTRGLAEGTKPGASPDQQDPAQVLFGRTHGRK